MELVMSEQILIQPIINENAEKAKIALEKARVAHERYLIRQNNSDLNQAIEYYIDAVKFDPTIPESYYRLASLMFEQGQISIETAIEQWNGSSTAITLKSGDSVTIYGLSANDSYTITEVEANANQSLNQQLKWGNLNQPAPD